MPTFGVAALDEASSGDMHQGTPIPFVKLTSGVLLLAVITLTPLCANAEEGLPVWSLDFSSDSRLLAAACGHRKATGMLRVWSTDDWKIQFDHQEDCNICNAAFSPDASQIALGLQNGDIAIFDIAERKVTKRWPSEKWAVFAVKWSPDGSELITGLANGAIKVWDPKTGELRLHLDTWQIDNLPNPRLAGDADRNIWDLDVTDDGKTLISGAWSGTTRLWNLHSGEQLVSFPEMDQSTQGVEFTAGDRFYIAVGIYCSKVHVRDTKTHQPRFVMSLGTIGRDASFHPKGGFLAVSTYENVDVFKIDLEGPTEEQSLYIEERIERLAAPNTSVRWMAENELAGIGLPASAQLLEACEHVDPLIKAAAKRLQGKMSLPRLTTLTGFNGAVRRVTYSPSGDFLATSTDNGDIHIWHGSNFKLLRKQWVSLRDPE